jgi:hypothetical protein
MTAIAICLLALLAIGRIRGWPRSRPARLAAGALALAAALAALPWGIDPERLGPARLAIALATLGVVVARRRGARWLADPRVELRALAVLAAAAVLVYLNFFSFHRYGRFVHQHDVAHYYLGSKYFAELGYGRLYDAALQAEAELHGNYFRSVEARDLQTGEVVGIGRLLKRGAADEEAFSAERWRSFRRDVDLFRDRNGAQYGLFLLDHGFNPTPVWAAIGGALANRVPAGSASGVLLLTLIDPILLLSCGILVGRSFGWRAACLATILFGVTFGATFAWTGGAFLRHLWFAATVASLCLLRRDRPTAAGAALGLAAMLRIFPGLLLWGWIWRAAGARRTDRAEAREAVRFVLGFAVGAALLVAATALTSRGWHSWLEFAANLRVQMASPAANEIGLVPLLRYLTSSGESSGVAFALRAAALLAAAIATARLSSRVPREAAWALGVVLVFVGPALPAYYWILLVPVGLAWHRQTAAFALFFALEAALWALALWPRGQAADFAAENVLMGVALAGLVVALGRRRPPAGPLRPAAVGAEAKPDLVRSDRGPSARIGLRG